MDWDASGNLVYVWNGGDQADTLDFSRETNRVMADGGDGNDEIVGGTADDQLFGGDGNDRLIGNAGNDTLIGGSGNDTLIAGTETDNINVLTGGCGTSSTAATAMT